MYDLIIIGGGPAAVAAGVYAARKKIKTLVIADFFGGQAVVAAQIENFIGTESLSGLDLSHRLEAHLRSYPEIIIKDGARATKIEKIDGGFQVIANSGENFSTKTILIATGSSTRKLKIINEEKFEGRGVFYCSTCDAPLMKNKIVAVIGDGNSALNAVFDLIPYASKIFLLTKNESCKGDPEIVDKVKNSGKVEIINFVLSQEILGNDFVTGLKYKDSRTGEIKTLSLDGIFVAIGYEPNSAIVQGLAEINEKGNIIIDYGTQKTTASGIWAAGDVANSMYDQINVAIGDGIKALLNIYDFLKKKS